MRTAVPTNWSEFMLAYKEFVDGYMKDPVDISALRLINLAKACRTKEVKNDMIDKKAHKELHSIENALRHFEHVVEKDLNKEMPDEHKNEFQTLRDVIIELYSYIEQHKENVQELGEE